MTEECQMCHKRRRIRARGVCASCYGRATKEGTRDDLPRLRVPRPECKDCERTREEVDFTTRDLCSACWRWRRTHGYPRPGGILLRTPSTGVCVECGRAVEKTYYGWCGACYQRHRYAGEVVTHRERMRAAGWRRAV